jgi:ribose-phosphate pyrophosphokinase
MKGRTALRPRKQTAAASSASESKASRFLLVGGSANPELSAGTATALDVPLARCAVRRFPDGEVAVELEESVRGTDVFILLPTAPPVNDHLIELLAIADACRRADASRITAVVPYIGYARSDKRQGHRTPVMVRAVADLMQTVGIGHVVTVDAHTPQIEGVFSIPIDDLSAIPVLAGILQTRATDDTVIVAPDLGAVWRASEYSRLLGRPTAVCVKRRTTGTSVAITQLIGAVRDRPCIIVDDMITTGSTIAECAKALSLHGARGGFLVAATHGVLLAGACDRMSGAGVREVFVCDTIAAPRDHLPLITRVTVAPLLADAIDRLRSGKSLHEPPLRKSRTGIRSNAIPD